MDRVSFKSRWNAVATLIFLAGIFLGVTILNYSGVGVAIFMWIIGGTVANLIYGDPKKGPIRQSSAAERVIQPPPTSKFCSSCSDENHLDAGFCMNCGAAFKHNTTSSTK
ncbi:MAG: hypothetical protein ACXAE3_15115 [Candidatus Kariarchaeaceae archaeon]|jgi:hypothetical protein